MLSSAQLAALKAHVAANTNTIQLGPDVVQIKDTPNSPDANNEVAAWYNGNASPDFWAWRTFVADTEVYETTTADATTWSWTIFIGRSQGERDAWRQMNMRSGGINPSLLNVRNGVADVFSGAGGAAQRTHLLAIGRRVATNAEKLFSTGIGTTVSPATMGREGNVSGGDVTDARNS